jgi:hypothetical protein
MAKPIELHPHAVERAFERGATEEEIIATVSNGESTPAKFGRTYFRRNFRFDAGWRGRTYATKQIEAVAVEEADRWLVITVLVKYF